jgi:hypothetical protein
MGEGEGGDQGGSIVAGQGATWQGQHVGAAQAGPEWKEARMVGVGRRREGGEERGLCSGAWNVGWACD